MEIIVFILYLFGLSLLVFRSKFFRVEGIKKLLLVFLWILKLIVGVYFYAISVGHPPNNEVKLSKDFFASSGKLYWIHSREPALFMDFMVGSGSNSEKYKEEVEKIGKKWNQGNENGIVNDNRTVIRINTLLHFISFRFYSVQMLFMCFLSFVGSVLLFKAFPKEGKKQIYAATIACFLVPSLLFWSVGVMKEPLLLLGLGGFLFYFRKIIVKFSFLSLVLLLLSIGLLLCLKIYIFAVVFPMMLVFFWCQKQPRLTVLKYLAATILFGTLFLLSHRYFPQKQIDVVHAVSVKNQQLYNIFLENNEAVTFQTPHLDGSIESLVKNIPLAAYNSLTKPIAYPMDSLAKVCTNLETLILALLLVVCLIFGNYKRFIHNNFAIFCTVVAIYGFLLIGLTTHEMGMIMRYKSLFLPFYLFGLIHLLDTEKVMHFLKIRKRHKKNEFDAIKNFEERIGKMTRYR